MVCSRLSASYVNHLISAAKFTRHLSTTVGNFCKVIFDQIEHILSYIFSGRLCIACDETLGRSTAKWAWGPTRRACPASKPE